MQYKESVLVSVIKKKITKDRRQHNYRVQACSSNYVKQRRNQKQKTSWCASLYFAATRVDWTAKLINLHDGMIFVGRCTNANQNSAPEAQVAAANTLLAKSRASSAWVASVTAASGSFYHKTMPAASLGSSHSATRWTAVRRSDSTFPSTLLLSSPFTFVLLSRTLGLVDMMIDIVIRLAKARG